MTDTTIALIIAAIPATIAAWKGITNSQSIAEVHTLTNSTLTEMQSKWRLSEARVVSLESEGKLKDDVIADLRRERDLARKPAPDAPDKIAA